MFNKQRFLKDYSSYFLDFTICNLTQRVHHVHQKRIYINRKWNYGLYPLNELERYHLNLTRFEHFVDINSTCSVIQTELIIFQNFMLCHKSIKDKLILLFFNYDLICIRKTFICSQHKMRKFLQKVQIANAESIITYAEKMILVGKILSRNVKERLQV